MQKRPADIATTLSMEQLLLEQSNDYLKNVSFLDFFFFLITLKGKWKVAG